MTKYEFAKKLYLIHGSSFMLSSTKGFGTNFVRDWLRYGSTMYIIVESITIPKYGSDILVSFSKEFYEKLNKEIE